jgi:outer membrane protein
MKTLFLIIAALSVSSIAFAQTTLKIGHINSQELVLAMPENDTAQVKIEKAAKSFEDQLQEMQKEFERKYKDLMSQRESLSELVRQTKADELQGIEQRIQQFQQNAEQDLQKQRANLYQPIFEKANKAISAVAKENGFTYILDLAQGGVIYYDEASTNILPLVKQKMGLKDKPIPAASLPAVKK